MDAIGAVVVAGHPRSGDACIGTVLLVTEERLLLERARAGDLDAFAELVTRTERRLRALLGRLLDDERDVEEAAQDTYVQAWRSLGRFRGDAEPFTWLYRIAVNEALQRTRRKRLETRPLEQSGTNEPATAPTLVDDTATGNERARFVAARLRALPAEQRAPVVLRDVEGWSNEEIADLLEISVAAVKSRVHRGRMQLREQMQAWERGQADA